MTNERARRIVDVTGAAADLTDAADADATSPDPQPPLPAAADDEIDGTAATTEPAAAELDASSPENELTEPFAVAEPVDADERDADEHEEPEAEQLAAEPTAEAERDGDAAETNGDDSPDDEEPDDEAAVTAEYESLPSVLEALLFVADEPIAASALGRALELTPAQVRRGLDELADALRDETRGVRLQQGPDGAQLVTAPEVAPTVEHFLGLEANRRLSNAALETLAIVAYRQPVTRHVIDQIRGVNSDGAIATLRTRGLIEGIGRAPGPGRPLLFSTTQRFLEHFGLERPEELPPLPEDVGLPAEARGAQLALEAAVDGEVETIDDVVDQAGDLERGDSGADEQVDEDSADEASQLAFDDEPSEGDESDTHEIEDDLDLEISDDVADLSRAASAALGGPAEASDGPPAG